MACRRRGRTPGSGETGRPRTRGGLRTRSGESGLPAPAPGAPGGPSSGSLANPSVHLGLSKAWAGKGIGPGGFEPPYPDPKSGVLPLDEGPGSMKRLNLALRGARVYEALELSEPGGFAGASGRAEGRERGALLGECYEKGPRLARSCGFAFQRNVRPNPRSITFCFHPVSDEECAPVTLTAPIPP